MGSSRTTTPPSRPSWTGCPPTDVYDASRRLPPTTNQHEGQSFLYCDTRSRTQHEDNVRRHQRTVGPIYTSPDLRNDLVLAEAFHQFFIDNILNIRRAIDLRAEPNTFDRQPSDVGLHQHAQLWGFTLATTADTRRIVLQSSAKSCDLDPMPTSSLKGNIDLLAPILTDIINTSLETGVVPVDMKHALVTPILKKRGLDVNSLTNYRPISNLSLVSKTLERYIANELRRHIDANGFNDPFQSAYRPRHSTETSEYTKT